MKHPLRTQVRLGMLVLIALFTLGACGQKGPLIVEQPPLDTVSTQEEELAPTK